MSFQSYEVVNAHTMFFKALSNKTRLGILNFLKEGPKNVSEISEKLGYEQSRVSHNLKCLTFCGFVSLKREGKRRIYSLNETIKPLLGLVDRHIELHAEHLRECTALIR